MGRDVIDAAIKHLTEMLDWSRRKPGSSGEAARQTKDEAALKRVLALVEAGPASEQQNAENDIYRALDMLTDRLKRQSEESEAAAGAYNDSRCGLLALKELMVQKLGNG